MYCNGCGARAAWVMGETIRREASTCTADAETAYSGEAATFWAESDALNLTQVMPPVRMDNMAAIVHGYAGLNFAAGSSQADTLVVGARSEDDERRARVVMLRTGDSPQAVPVDLQKGAISHHVSLGCELTKRL